LFALPSLPPAFFSFGALGAFAGFSFDAAPDFGAPEFKAPAALVELGNFVFWPKMAAKAGCTDTVATQRVTCGKVADVTAQQRCVTATQTATSATVKRLPRMEPKARQEFKIKLALALYQ